MLLDPNWRRKELLADIGRLADWLETKPPAGTYDYCAIHDCIAAQYLREHGVTDDFVNMSDYPMLRSIGLGHGTFGAAAARARQLLKGDLRCTKWWREELLNDISRLARWLESKPPAETYNYANGDFCAAAQYLRAHGFKSKKDRYVPMHMYPALSKILHVGNYIDTFGAAAVRARQHLRHVTEPAAA